MKRILAAWALLLSAIFGANAAAMQAFKAGGQTVLVSASTTAATVTLSGAGGSLLVFNACTVPARIDATGAPATTPTAGTPGSLSVPASSLTVLEIGTTVATVSVKIDTGTACNVELTRGEGMAH